jgi:hypothetical protein
MLIKYFVVFLSVLLIFGGIYFKLVYDVPDGQEGLNNFVSWVLVVFGIIGIMTTAMWKTKNPLALDDKDNPTYFLKRDRNTPSNKSTFSINHTRDFRSSRNGSADI